MVSYRLLIVDDNDGIRTLLADIFHDAGYAVQTATNGWEAIECLARHTYDVVLTDLEMPVVNGRELATTLRKRFTRIPLVVMTGSTGGAALAREMDAAAYVEKPFDLTTVVSTVGAAVSGQPMVSAKDARAAM
jgi:two-component system, response regulator, stage 0 sporulation protein F